MEREKLQDFYSKRFYWKEEGGEEKNQRNQNDSESKKEGMKLNIGGVWRFEDQVE